MMIFPDTPLTWKVYEEHGNVCLVLNTKNNQYTDETAYSVIPPAFARALALKLLQIADFADEQMPCIT